MSEQPTLTEEIQPVAKPRRLSGRLGCLILFPIWLIVMLIPCFFITLAFQQQIIISQGDAPGQYLRIWLINEADNRGLGFSSTSVHSSQTDNNVCIQTDVRFFLWMGSEEPSSYCDCYAKPDNSDELELASVNEGICEP